jgi:hypothetical protein
MYLLYIFPLELHTLMASLFFNPSKKHSFGCAANRKNQRLISIPTYTEEYYFLGPDYMQSRRRLLTFRRNVTAFFFFRLVNSSTVKKMESVLCSEVAGNFFQTIRRLIPGDSAVHLKPHRSELWPCCAKHSCRFHNEFAHCDFISDCLAVQGGHFTIIERTGVSGP